VREEGFVGQDDLIQALESHEAIPEDERRALARHLKKFRSRHYSVVLRYIFGVSMHDFKNRMTELMQTLGTGGKPIVDYLDDMKKLVNELSPSDNN
jgi:hypothetical protein